MKKYAGVFIASALAAAVAAGCAKSESFDYSVVEQQSLDEWMKLHEPQAQRMPDGSYIQTLEDGLPNAPTVKYGDWVFVDYTYTDLGGNVVGTRDEATARRQGTYTPYTHYTPDYVYFYDPDKITAGTQIMISGQYQALVGMRVGEVRRTWLPSPLAYGSSGYNNAVGYGGEYSLPANVPMTIRELKVVEVVEKPLEREEKLVQAYAQEKLELSPADSLVDNLYLKITRARPGATKIAQDSTVKIYYVGRFLDGFVFETNIDSVQWRLYGQINNKNVMSYKPSRKTGIAAWYEVIPTMRYGEHGIMVFTSQWGYGLGKGAALLNAGSDEEVTYTNSLLYNPYSGYGGYGYDDYTYMYYNSMYYQQMYNNYLSPAYNSPRNDESDEDVVVSTEILPYTPLVYEFYIQPYNEDIKEHD